jgi:hypothetical protein
MIGRDEKMLAIFEWIRTGGQVRHLGLDPRPDRLRQGSRGAHDPRVVAPRSRELPGRQLRGAARTACSNRKSSATKRAPSPARTIASPDASSWPTAARCSSTKSATCR